MSCSLCWFSLYPERMWPCLHNFITLWKCCCCYCYCCCCCYCYWCYFYSPINDCVGSTHYFLCSLSHFIIPFPFLSPYFSLTFSNTSSIVSYWTYSTPLSIGQTPIKMPSNLFLHVVDYSSSFVSNFSIP